MGNGNISQVEIDNLIRQVDLKIYGGYMPDFNMFLINKCLCDYKLSPSEVMEIYNEAKAKSIHFDSVKLNLFASFVSERKFANEIRTESALQFIKYFEVKMVNGDEIIVTETHFDFDKFDSDIIDWFENSKDDDVYCITNSFGNPVYFIKKYVVSITLSDMCPLSL